MNPPPTSRFSCRVVRWSAAVLGTSAARHCAACEECQAFFADDAELEHALRRQAPRMAAEPLPGFEQRLRAAVREVQPDFAAERAAAHARAAARPRSLFPVWAGAVAAAVALAAVFVVNRPARDGGSPSDLALSPSDLASTVGSVAQSLTESWETKVAPAAQTLAQDNPVRQEIDAVYADGQRAVRFLAMNFLPSETPKRRSGGGNSNGTI